MATKKTLLTHNIRSSHITRAGHDDHTHVLTLEFDDGTIYEYRDVAVRTWEELRDATANASSRIFWPKIQPNHHYRQYGTSDWIAPQPRYRSRTSAPPSRAKRPVARARRRLSSSS